MATIRLWERKGILPEDLRPIRDSRNRRFWKESQIPGLVKWLHSYGRTISTGAVEAPMSDEQVDRYLTGVREKRDEVRMLRDEVKHVRAMVEEIRANQKNER